MAQVIQPEEWVQGLDDNRLLPGRYTTGLFTGSLAKGESIANNPNAMRVYDIVVSDYITDYDDRRLNGHGYGKVSNFNQDGRDGWGASAYGVFQDVRFESRVYTMGRHRSVAFRIFDEMQYSGGIGQWGNASESNVVTSGQALMQTAALISKTRDLWEKEILGPDIDKYNLFAVLNGHISGRWVAIDPVTGIDYTDQIMDGNAAHGQWVAQPGTVQGEAIPPRFAPIHGVEWDDNAIMLFLQNLKVTWNNLFIPEDNRVIMMDAYYELPLMMALTGGSIPATEKAYSDIQNGSFTRLMGWEFNFDIPSQYWPKLFFDANLNVVHSADGAAAYDVYMRSQDFSNAGHKELLYALTDAARMRATNYIKTVWDPATQKYVRYVTNHPLGMPSAVDYYGDSIVVNSGDVYNRYAGSTSTDLQYSAVPADDFTTSSTTAHAPGAALSGVNASFAKPNTYPWSEPGAGYGLPIDGNNKFPDGVNAGPDTTGTAFDGKTGIQLRQVIGCAVYRPAAQLSQEYSEMRTSEGNTRGKFTECVMDVKYDAWVIEKLSHGIIPIVDDAQNTGIFALPVKIIETSNSPIGPNSSSSSSTSSTTQG